MTKKKPSDTFSQKEVADAANNLVARALRPTALGEIPDTTLRGLRAFTQALVEICFELVEEGALLPEELVVIFSCGALFTQMHYVMGTSKLPMGPKADELLG